ncbi:MAG: multidrug efflux SMR transporter [Anaerolineae bacterium]|nr:multidrug efflux SMR transporter [Anaerolineae bacterium]
MHWFYLAAAIFTEIAGTVTMKFAQGFTKLTPSIMVFVFYVASTGFLTLALKEIDLSIAYSIWSGVGIVFTALVGFFWFKEDISLAKSVFIAMILVGVVGLYLGDRATPQ